jgi:hypothetical protein
MLRGPEALAPERAPGSGFRVRTASLKAPLVRRARRRSATSIPQFAVKGNRLAGIRRVPQERLTGLRRDVL